MRAGGRFIVGSNLHLSHSLCDISSLYIRKLKCKKPTYMSEWMKMETKIHLIAILFLHSTGSKNAPFKCYEEIQIQRDRFGNCGKQNNKYKTCKYGYVTQVLIL